MPGSSDQNRKVVIYTSFDELVSAQEEKLRNRQPKRLGGP